MVVIRSLRTINHELHRIRNRVIRHAAISRVKLEIKQSRVYYLGIFRGILSAIQRGPIFIFQIVFGRRCQQQLFPQPVIMIHRKHITVFHFIYILSTIVCHPTGRRGNNDQPILNRIIRTSLQSRHNLSHMAIHHRHGIKHFFRRIPCIILAFRYHETILFTGQLYAIVFHSHKSRSCFPGRQFIHNASRDLFIRPPKRIIGLTGIRIIKIRS